MAVARDGTLYIGSDLQRVRRVNPDQTIITIAESIAYDTCTIHSKDCNPRGPAMTVDLLALESSGALLMSTVLNGAIGRISTGFSATRSVSEIYVASNDASEIYAFDLSGRHLRTLDGLTTATRLTFGYDTAGRLITATDASGNVTTIQRDGKGGPTAIVSPYGQSTGLTLDGNGYLASITNPNNESVQLQYTPPVVGVPHTGGLLSQLTDARAGIHQFQFSSEGFLTRDTPPDGAYQALDRHGKLSALQVTHSTALGRNTNYSVSWDQGSGAETSSITPPDGFATTTVTNSDHSTTTTTPDGMQVKTTATPDPRFGMDAFAVSSMTTTTPSGLARTVTESRTATMVSAVDPLTLRTLLTQL